MLYSSRAIRVLYLEIREADGRRGWLTTQACRRTRSARGRDMTVMIMVFGFGSAEASR